MERSESEKRIEARLRRRCTELGWLCPKMRPFEVGYPDRLILCAGRPVFVEIKSTGCRPRPTQVRRMRQLSELGYECRVIDTSAGVDELIDELKKRQDEL